MKRQTKILLAAVLVVVVAGLAVFVAKPDLLKGRMKLVEKAPISKTITRVCVSGAIVYNSDPSFPGIYRTFNDFVYAVENNTLQDCNYFFQGGEHLIDNFIAKCSKSDLYAFTDQIPAISCSKQVGNNFYRFDLYEKFALVNFHMDQMDTDTFGMSTYKAYKPFDVHVE